MTGNQYSRDVSGAHLRAGGYLTNNLWAANVAGSDFGRYFTATNYSITNDIYTENVTDTSPAGAGGGGEDGTSIGTIGSYDSIGTPNGLANYASGTLSVTGTIWSNSQATEATNGYCLAVSKAAHTDDPPAGVTGVVTAQNNIVYNWETGDWNGNTGYNPKMILRDNTGTSDQSPTNFPPAGGLAVIPYRPSANANRICITSAAMTGGYDDFGGSGDLNNYPYPTTATLTGYAQYLGYADLDAYCNACQLQSMDTWNVALMAESANAWIRAGFGISPSTSFAALMGQAWM